MKRLFTLFVALMATTCLFAQNTLNDKADSVIGDYESIQNGDGYKTHLTKNADGTYKAQIFWVSNPYDKKGNRKLDPKNPDKSLRNTPCDQIVLFDGLKYDAAKKQWGDTKIYDPQRGLKAKLTAVFNEKGQLLISGKVGPFGETSTWTRIK